MALVLLRDVTSRWLSILVEALSERGYDVRVIEDPTQLLQDLASVAGEHACLVVVDQASLGSPASERFREFLRSYVGVRAGAPPARICLLVVRHRGQVEDFRSYDCIDVFLWEPFDRGSVHELLARWEQYAGW